MKHEVVTYTIDPNALMWGDTDRPIISFVVLQGIRYIDWVPTEYAIMPQLWWRWN